MSDVRETLTVIYDRLATEGAIRPDPAQRAVLPELERIRAALEDAAGRKKGLLGGLFGKPSEAPKGLYLWGGVGRGKSMLMDLFHENCAIAAKRRVHFHAFMQDVQRPPFTPPARPAPTMLSAPSRPGSPQTSGFCVLTKCRSPTLPMR